MFPKKLVDQVIPGPQFAIMFSPVLKKIEEKVQVKKDEDSKDGSPPLKKLCTAYTKQLAKLPAGNQGLVKDMSGDWYQEDFVIKKIFFYHMLKIVVKCFVIKKIFFQGGCANFLCDLI